MSTRQPQHKRQPERNAMKEPSAAALLSALPVCVIMLDRDNAISWLNPAAEEWLGTSVRNAAGKPVFRFIPDAHVGVLANRVRKHQESLSQFDYAIGKEMMNLHASPLENGQVVLVMKPRRYVPAQAALGVLQEKMRTSGLMAAMLAHEVKNPLSSIRGAAQLLLEDASSDHQPLLALIRDETDRIKSVLEQIEPFSESEPPALVPVDVHEALQYVVRSAQAGVARGIAVHEEYDSTLTHVLASRDRLVQAVFNLVKNAAEALEGRRDARIQLSTTSRQDFDVIGRDGRIQAQAHVIVEDNGPGIQEQLRAHLFEPFVSGRQEKGRGLGLSIASKLANDMGGVLALEKSEPGCTRFRLTLRVS